MAGRVLSAANETKLRAALEAIAAVLDSLGGGGAGEPQEEAAAPGAFGGATPEGDGDVTEAAIDGDCVPLTEAAIRGDGTALLRLIVPGWGSSGYYPAEVLKRDGPGIFKAGVKTYWDHATAAEEAERPEGSLSKLAGELVSDARWQDSGPDGAGLYADVKVFGPYKEAVNELAPHIGVSIRASGRTKQGEAEGRKGPIVEQLVAARSVDWVTVPGAGGKVVQMFEAARPPRAAEIQQENNDMELQEQLAEAQARIVTLQEEAARYREALVLRKARDVVLTALATAQVPDVTRARLLESLSVNPPVVEGEIDVAALTARIEEAVTAERTYLAEAAGYGTGRIVGMGGAGADKPAVDLAAKLKEAFGALGLSDAEATIAAAGRI